MVTLSFLLPLASLVRDLAADRVLTRAERDAESIARFVAVLAPAEGMRGAFNLLEGGELARANASVILASGEVIGSAVPIGEDLSQARDGVAFRAEVEGGEAVYVPLVQSDGSTSVVRVFVPADRLRQGVARSWRTLGLLGVVLLVMAVVVFDSLARSVVRSIRELSETTNRLSDGDMHARATPSGPIEVATVGHGLNRLADRFEDLLQQERETVANFSHRLRTPLAAARLSAESVADVGTREQLVSDLDELDRTVDHVIAAARRPSRLDATEVVDMNALVRERVEFWTPLVEDQGRRLEMGVTIRSLPVRIWPADAQAMIDALLVNVIAHTPPGTALRVSLLADDPDGLVLAVEDSGPGFPDLGVMERGRSGSNSTGLGLDIVSATTAQAGGKVRLGRSRRMGGAMVVVWLPVFRFERERDRSIRRRSVGRGGARA